MPLNRLHWPLTTLLVVVHAVALSVAWIAWIDGYRFARPLFACTLTSIAINGYGCFAPPANQRVFLNRLALAAVVLGCAIGAPLLKLARIEPGPYIWLVTGVQAARALWIAPRGAPRLSARKLLLVLAALCVWMFATPRMVRWSHHQEDHLFANIALAAAVVVLASRRTGWTGGLIFGGRRRNAGRHRHGRRLVGVP